MPRCTSRAGIFCGKLWYLVGMKLICQCFLLVTLALLPPQMFGQELTDPIPQVLVRTNPTYPPIAITAHIQGDVRVKVTTDGTSVVNAEAESGPPLLQLNTLKSVRTWKFTSHTPATFYLMFRFKLMEGNQVAFEESPGVFQIQADAPTFLGYNYPSIDLGKWQVQINTRTGVLRKTFWISRLEQHGESIEVATKAPSGGCPDYNYGHFDDKFVDFVMGRSSDDDEFTTIFVGRLTDDKIVGTYVDQNGVTGTWSAVQVSPTTVGTELNPNGCIRTVE
jgi:Gram-negative bacterial TonB protein C-terminal